MVLVVVVVLIPRALLARTTGTAARALRTLAIGAKRRPHPHAPPLVVTNKPKSPTVLLLTPAKRSPTVLRAIQRLVVLGVPKQSKVVPVPQLVSLL